MKTIIKAANIAYYGHVAIVTFYIASKKGETNKYQYKMDSAIGREVWETSRKKPGRALNLAKKHGTLMPVDILC